MTWLVKLSETAAKQLGKLDNGRVVGFDNQHGYHHRHFMGKTESIEFVSFEELENQFDQEWFCYLKQNREAAS